MQQGQQMGGEHKERRPFEVLKGKRREAVLWSLAGEDGFLLSILTWEELISEVFLIFILKCWAGLGEGSPSPPATRTTTGRSVKCLLEPSLSFIPWSLQDSIVQNSLSNFLSATEMQSH